MEMEVKVVESCMVTPSEERRVFSALQEAGHSYSTPDLPILALGSKMRGRDEGRESTASEETPSHVLWLSPLDLILANRGHTPTVYFYRSDQSSRDFFDVARVKAAMAKALVAFYPLAGRLSMNADDGRSQVDCGCQGALFVVARSDLTVDDFSDFRPSPELRRLFVPRVEDTPGIVCAMQVTFLRCGGVALGTALHHVAVDAVSAFHFFQTWSAISRDHTSDSTEATAALEIPFYDRTLLRARSPPFVHPDALSVFCPKLNLSEPSGPAVSETFVISKDQVAALKLACTGGGGGRMSTFCALSAHVWRCVCEARRLPPDATTRLTFPANVRRGLKPPLPAGYLGNGIIWLGSTGKVRDVVAQEEMATVAGRIRGSVRRMDDEPVRSAIDYFEMEDETGNEPVPGDLPATELRVISWLGMPVYDADFGWGKPLVMLRAVSERAGFVYLMDGGQGEDGSVRMVVCMEARILDDFQRLLYANF